MAGWGSVPRAWHGNVDKMAASSHRLIFSGRGGSGSLPKVILGHGVILFASPNTKNDRQQPPVNPSQTTL